MVNKKNVKGYEFGSFVTLDNKIRGMPSVLRITKLFLKCLLKKKKKEMK